MVFGASKYSIEGVCKAEQEKGGYLVYNLSMSSIIIKTVIRRLIAVLLVSRIPSLTLGSFFKGQGGFGNKGG